MLQPMITDLEKQFSKSDELKEFISTHVDFVAVSLIKRELDSDASKYHRDESTDTKRKNGLILRVLQPFKGQGTKVVHEGAHYQCDRESAGILDGVQYTHKAPPGGWVARIDFMSKMSPYIPKTNPEYPAHMRNVRNRLLKWGRENAPERVREKGDVAIDDYAEDYADEKLFGQIWKDMVVQRAEDELFEEKRVELQRKLEELLAA